MSLDYESLLEFLRIGLVAFWSEDTANRHGTAVLTAEIEDALRENAKVALDAYLAEIRAEHK